MQQRALGRLEAAGRAVSEITGDTHECPAPHAIQLEVTTAKVVRLCPKPFERSITARPQPLILMPTQAEIDQTRLDCDLRSLHEKALRGQVARRGVRRCSVLVMGPRVAAVTVLVALAKFPLPHEKDIPRVHITVENLRADYFERGHERTQDLVRE